VQENIYSVYVLSARQ